MQDYGMELSTTGYHDNESHEHDDYTDIDDDNNLGDTSFEIFEDIEMINQAATGL